MSAPTLHRIRASAGSGKTYALTGRFIDLLAASAADPAPAACGRRAEGYGWREICAVTFTNRAADEMRSRIVQDLKRLALGTAVPARTELPPGKAARWVSLLLRRYGSLNVRTIDSLLLSVVRMAAPGLGLPPDLSPSFDVRELVDPLIDLVLSRTDAATEAIVRKACRDLAERDPGRLGLTGKGILRDAVLLLSSTMDRDAMQGLPSDYADAERLREREDALAETLSSAARALRDRLDGDGLRTKAAFAAFLDLCATDRPDADSLKDKAFAKNPRPIEDCLLKASKGHCTDETLRLYDLFSDALLLFLDESLAIKAAMPYAAFVPLAGIVHAMLPDRMREAGAVPQPLMAPMAADVLERTDAAEILCRMGGGMAHLLVDEFQDTSVDQWRALRPLALDALSRGGSLTWVGDVKQSIYGWRGGDPSLFDAVLRDPRLSAVVPEPVDETLPDNWRSREEIVRFNNAVFSRLADLPTARAVMRALAPAASEAEAEPLAAAFAHAVQNPAAPDGVVRRPGGLVTVGVLQASSASGLDELVEAALAGRATEILRRRPPGDLAVLVRSHDQAALAAKWLSDRGVPVVTEASLRIDAHPLVRELLSLLTLADAPDDIALWTLLSGGRLLGGRLPEGFRPEEWLFANADRGPLARRLETTAPEAWNAVNDLLLEAVRPDAYGTVANALKACRIAERLPDELPAAERLLEAAYLAVADGARSVPAFLALRRGDDGEEDGPLPDGPDAVRIMTVHKAKGLEFPAVIVPWNEIDRQTSGTPRRAVLGDGSVILAPPSKGDPDYASGSAAIAREALHRTYVAWTRASDELHVLLTSTDRSEASAEVFRILTDGLLAEGGDTAIGTPEARRTPPRTTTAKGPSSAGSDVPRVRDSDWLPALEIAETTGIPDASWAECEGHVSDPAVKALLARLRELGVPAPATGYDLIRGGKVAGNAELAWPKAKVGVLLPGDDVDAKGYPDWNLLVMGDIDADALAATLRG